MYSMPLNCLGYYASFKVYLGYSYIYTYIHTWWKSTHDRAWPLLKIDPYHLRLSSSHWSRLRQHLSSGIDLHLRPHDVSWLLTTAWSGHFDLKCLIRLIEFLHTFPQMVHEKSPGMSYGTSLGNIWCDFIWLAIPAFDKHIQPQMLQIRSSWEGCHLYMTSRTLKFCIFSPSFLKAFHGPHDLIFPPTSILYFHLQRLSINAGFLKGVF